MAETIGIISAIGSLVSGGMGFLSSRKAARAGKKANQSAERAALIKEQREQRAALRDARVQAATAQQGAENQGAGASSSGITGPGSIISQGNANASFLDQIYQVNKQTSSYLQKASDYSSSAQTYSGFSTAFGSIDADKLANTADKVWGRFKSVFD